MMALSLSEIALMDPLTAFAIVWGTLGLMTGCAALAKGHHFLGWIFLGCLFGIFAFTYIAFAERMQD
jgi:hypothetical protein